MSHKMLADQLRTSLNNLKRLTLNSPLVKPTIQLSHFSSSSSSRIHSTRHNLTLPNPINPRQFYLSSRNLVTTTYLTYNSPASNPAALPNDALLTTNDSTSSNKYSDASDREVLDKLKLVARRDESVKDVDVKELMESVGERCHGLGYQELMAVLGCLGYLESSEAGVEELARKVDEECASRLDSWKTEEAMPMCERMCKLGLGGESRFVKACLGKIKLEEISKESLMQLVGLLEETEGLGGTGMDLGKLEESLEKWVNELSVEEIAKVATAYHRSGRKWRRQNVMVRSLDKLMMDMEAVGDETVVEVLRVCDCPPTPGFTHILNILFDDLVHDVQQRKLNTLAQIAEFQGRHLMVHETFTSSLLERFEKEVKNATSKDIERMLFCLSSLHYEPKETPFYKAASDELVTAARDAEHSKSPLSLLHSVLYMLHVNYLPAEALKKILQPEYVERLAQGEDVQAVQRAYRVVEHCLELDHPDCDRSAVKEARSRLVEKFGQPTATAELSEKENHAVKDYSSFLAKHLKSRSHIHIDTLLPYSRSKEIVLCLEQQKNLYHPPGDELSKLPHDEVKYTPKDENKWYAVTFAFANQLTRGDFKPCGELAMRMRHLKVAGYVPLMLPYTKWQNLSVEGKEDYI